MLLLMLVDKKSVTRECDAARRLSRPGFRVINRQDLSYIHISISSWEEIRLVI